MATAGATPRAQRPGSRAGIVSTMRFPAFGADAVRSFVRYHASVGFARMYLFFDDPFDRAADVAAASLDGFRFEGAELECAVVVVRHDAALRARWSRCRARPLKAGEPVWRQLALYAHTLVHKCTHAHAHRAAAAANAPATTSTIIATTNPVPWPPTQSSPPVWSRRWSVLSARPTPA